MAEQINLRYEQNVLETIRKIKENKDTEIEEPIIFLSTLKSKKDKTHKYHIGIEYDDDNCFWLYITTMDMDGHEEKTFITDLNIDDEELFSKEIVKFVRHMIAHTGEWCHYCYKPFTFSSETLKITASQDKLISNFCKDCADKQIITLHAAVHRGVNLDEMECNICHTKCLELCEQKEDNNKHTYQFNRLFHVACCKNKILCEKCVKEQNEPKRQNKCFFCKQNFERGCCVFF